MQHRLWAVVQDMVSPLAWSSTHHSGPSTGPRPRITLLAPAELSLVKETSSPPDPSHCSTPYFQEFPLCFPIPAPPHHLLPQTTCIGDQAVIMGKGN